MANGVLNLNLIKDGAIVEFNKESVANGAPLRIMILHAEAAVFNAVDLSTEGVNARIGGGGIGAKKKK